MIFNRKILIPKDVKAQVGILDSNAAEARNKKIQVIKNILDGSDNRLLMIIGPCSADNEEAVLEYCEKLSHIARRVEDYMVIVPRVFTGKPRSRGIGYKGMLHEPVPGTPDLEGGIIAARKMLMRVINETALFPADEILYPEDYRYFDDLLVYATIGARSVLSQQHRMTASGCLIPVGMKNSLDGDMVSMVQSIQAAKAQHNFLYRGWDVTTEGNPYAHAVLRGGFEHPNYHYEDIRRLCVMYDGPIIVDLNHGNSQKHWWEQSRICKEVIEQRKNNNQIRGVMVESYLVEGRQDKPEIYGQSITDGCLGWSQTEKLIWETYWKIYDESFMITHKRGAFVNEFYRNRK